MKNLNDAIRNGTRDLPDCSAVPQPTALLRAYHPTILGFESHESQEKMPEYYTPSAGPEGSRK